MTTGNPASRLDEARARQQATQKRIEALATDSIVAWLSGVLRRYVGPLVHKVVSWFARLFR
ncbi:MAG TPA: hypothetical protein VGG39_37115 [Polyangiaceae bacterium]|jgi:hypothetical protein